MAKHWGLCHAPGCWGVVLAEYSRDGDRTTVAIPSDIAAEVEQAFDNVDHTLKDAGGKGMEQVYKLVVYCAPMDDAVEGALKAGLRKWFPKHQPILTGVGVAKLAFDGMHVEIEASAHLG